jgi:hypothetical protein
LKFGRVQEKRPDEENDWDHKNKVNPKTDQKHPLIAPLHSDSKRRVSFKEPWPNSSPCFATSLLKARVPTSLVSLLIAAQGVTSSIG